MTDTRCPAPIGFADVVDYWAGELSGPRRTGSKSTCSPAPIARGNSPQLKRWLAVSMQWAREGRLHSVVSDAILNRLAADGLRIRMYTLEGAGTVHCAVWADDDLVVAQTGETSRR